MKAFSPEMFTEQAQASLRQEAYNILEQKPMAIRSVLEAEDDSIMMEMQARREMYISLLESQQQGLGIIDEAGLGGKMIAAIIAGIIAIIGALIAMLTGSKGSSSSGGGSSSSSNTSSTAKTSAGAKTSSSSSSSFKPMSDKEYGKFTQDLLDARNNPNAEPHILSGKVHDMTSEDFEKGMNDKNSTLIIGGKTGSTFKHKNYVDNDSDIDSSLRIDDELNKKYFEPIGVSTSWFTKDDSDIEVSIKYRITGKQFRKVAYSMASVEVIKYELPDVNVCSGNLGSINELISVCNDLISAYNSIQARDISAAKSEFDKIKNKLDNASEDIKKTIDHETSLNKDKDPVPVNPGEFIDNELKRIKNLKYAHIGRYEAPPTKFDNVHSLENLKKSLEKLLKKANETEWYSEDNDSESTLKSLNDAVKDLRTACKDLAAGIANCARNYDETERNIARQITKVDEIVKNQCISLAENHELSKFESAAFLRPFNLEEAMIYGDSSYTESGILQEFAFGQDTTIQEDYSGYYRDIDDMMTRASILIHKYQMRAMNEEALIFSENISDYEKFQRLQAVNEALADKIKRGWYNAVAAIKEIFRKFSEKLTANFTTTKNYMDRYKNIILNADFNPNDTYKTQQLDDGIERIYNDLIIKLNFNDVSKEDFSTVGQCFVKFFANRGLSAGPNAKIPDENASIGDINEYWKTYFCMQGHEHTYTGKEFQQHIKEFYNFLYDIRKITKSIKDGIKEVEDNATRIMKQAGLDVNKPAEQPAQSTQNTAPTANAAAPQQAGQESTVVYSNLYQKYFTLNENGLLVEAEINKGTDHETQGTEHVASLNKNDDSQEIRNTERGTVDAKVKAYTDICVSMLKAKMSACEFIRNELMQIIRNHVQAHIGNKAANPQQPQQQQNQNQQQQQQPQQSQQQAQQQTQQAKPTIGQRVRNAANALRGQ